MTYSLKEISSRVIWDSFRDKYSPQALFQGWLWGMLEMQLGHKVWRFGVFSENKLYAIFQVIKVKARRGNFLHVRHGPVLKENNEKLWEQILIYLAELAHKERCWFVRLSPLLTDTPEIRLVYKKLNLRPSPIHAMDAELACVLDLDKSGEELLAGMRKTTRYEIKQAQKLGVEVIKSTSKADLQDFLKLYRETSDRHGFVPHSGIAEEFEIYGREKRTLLLLGKYESKIIASALILFDNGQAIYHHGASLWSKVPAAYLVQWEAILEAKKRGFKLYNFWGIAPEEKPNHPWRGLTLFKTGFGGHEVSYIHAQDLPISRRYFLTRGVETIRRIAKGY